MQVVSLPKKFTCAQNAWFKSQVPHDFVESIGIDFAQTEFIDSASIGMLSNLMSRTDRLVFTNIKNSNILNLLKISPISKFVEYK